MTFHDEEMGRFEHGGDIYRNAGALDFSANLNPLGMPEGVADAICAHVGDYLAYPDPLCQKLTDALAAHLGVPACQVLVCAGASDLMARVCQTLRPKRALVTAPCYSGYEQALEQVGSRIFRHQLRERDGFALTRAVLDDIDDTVDLVFLASPNNPTGVCVDMGLFEEVLAAAAAHGATVVLDECFIEFTDCESALGLVASHDNFVLMRAFTKMYALAGLRLGYGVTANERLMAGLIAAGQPWAVSTPAQVAGVASLKAEPAFSAATRAYVARERAFLCGVLRACGMQVVKSAANYVLFRSAVPLYDALLEHGIMVRRCANYQGLDAGWYRIAVRTTDENRRFAAALEEVLA